MQAHVLSEQRVALSALEVRRSEAHKLGFWLSEKHHEFRCDLKINSRS